MPRGPRSRLDPRHHRLYRIRFEDPEKTATRIYDEWIHPVLEKPKFYRKSLTGKEEKVVPRFPLIDGTRNVYTKGACVLHMLRYAFLVHKGNDDAFWEMLRDFLREYRGQQAATADFTAHAEKHFGENLGWFWDQWVYGSVIPVVSWQHSVEPKGDQWLLTVKAEQAETEHVLVIPVSVHFKGARTVSRPLLMRGAKGKMQVLLPERPRSVTLNDGYEALIDLQG